MAVDKILKILLILVLVYINIKKDRGDNQAPFSLEILNIKPFHSLLIYPANDYNRYKDDSLYSKILNSSKIINTNNYRGTNAHETTHYANSEYSTSTHKAFLIDNRYNLLPKITKFKLSDVAKTIPPIYRTSRYNLYLIQQQKYFQDNPTYIFDEWIAYINGTRVALEDCQNETFYEGKVTKVDRAVPLVEFSIFSLYLGEMVKQYHPEYWEEYRAFIYHHLNVSQKTYIGCLQYEKLNWPTPLRDQIVSDEKLKDILTKDYNSIWLP